MFLLKLCSFRRLADFIPLMKMWMKVKGRKELIANSILSSVYLTPKLGFPWMVEYKKGLLVLYYIHL